jgi:hypothetical protein
MEVYIYRERERERERERKRERERERKRYIHRQTPALSLSLSLSLALSLGLSLESYSIARLDSCCLQGVSLKDRLITSRFSKNDFNGLSDYVKDISKNLNICMRSSCEKEHNP